MERRRWDDQQSFAGNRSVGDHRAGNRANTSNWNHRDESTWQPQHSTYANTGGYAGYAQQSGWQGDADRDNGPIRGAADRRDGSQNGHNGGGGHRNVAGQWPALTSGESNQRAASADDRCAALEPANAMLTVASANGRNATAGPSSPAALGLAAPADSLAVAAHRPGGAASPSSSSSHVSPPSQSTSASHHGQMNFSSAEHPNPAYSSRPAGRPTNPADPFDDRYKAAKLSPENHPQTSNLLVPGRGSPPRKSEFYDSFLDGYIDSYSDARKRQTAALGEADNMAYRQDRPQQGNSPYSPERQPLNSDMPYGNNSMNRIGSPYDDRQPTPAHHTPYRDMTPSPDLHPGFGSRHSPPRFAPYNSPPTRVDPKDRKAGTAFAAGAAGVGAGAAALGSTDSPFSDPHRASPSPTQFQPYNPYQSGRNSPYASQNNLNHSQAYNNNNNHSSSSSSTPPPQPPPHFSGPNGGFGNRGASPYASPNHPYQNPYDSHSISRNNLNGLDYIDPNAVVEDGDEGLEYLNPKRKSVLSLNRRSMGSNTTLAGPGAAAAIGAGTGTAAAATAGAFAGRGPSDLSKSVTANEPTEKFPPIRDPNTAVKSKKWKRIFFILIGLVILGGIVAGLVIGLLKRGTSNSNKGASSGSGSGSGSNTGPGGNSADGGSDSGDLNLHSPAVQSLLNNKNLHKVFMGMAYTPMNTQYPACLTTPAIQNNVTLDLAVLSQLTNVIRLYGTDCNQTQMVLHAIDQLQLTDMKVWAGVWLENNVTTNDRQMKQFYEILDQYGTKNLKGVIVGNEVLFRQDLTLAQLEQYVTYVRSNLTSRNVNLPVASADLGDNWTADFASKVDVIMSNVHPFFAGVKPEDGASWAWSFWQTHDVILTQNPKPGQQVISEIGWPSQGGNDCGTDAACPTATDGAIAGIDEMNTFLGVWVCPALQNQTEYFWFESYDEPWKVQFDTAGQAWEDHWGLFDVNRNLKTGVTIPNCGGSTVPTA